jgi:hypothetical protein
MMTLERLKYYISVRLKSLTTIDVYDTKAKDGATFPYLTFIFSDSNFITRRREDRTLEINFWNNTNDDSGILIASNLVKNGKFNDEGDLLVPGLDYSYQNESEGFYRCFCEKDHEIPDPEINISRIYQRYTLNVG